MNKKFLYLVMIFLLPVIGWFVLAGVSAAKSNNIGFAVLMFVFAAVYVVLWVNQVRRISRMKDLKPSVEDRKAFATWLEGQGWKICSFPVKTTHFTEVDNVLGKNGQFEEAGRERITELAIISTDEGEKSFSFDKNGKIILEKFRIIELGSDYALIQERNSPWNYQLYQK